MWGQGGRREREGGGSHFTRYGINESFTLQEFHILSPRDHPQMTVVDFLTPFLQRGEKKIKLSSVTHVPSGLMGCALAALGWWVGGRRKFKHA